MTFEKLLMYSVTYFGLVTGVFFLITFLENRRRIHNPVCKSFPKVSVGVPMYDVADHLRKTVESLLALDWPKDKLEIMIVDDGSTDNSYRIAKEYDGDSRIKVFRQKNSGKCAAINLALKNATGDFFAVLDVDAFVEPDTLKRMMGFFENPKVMAVTPSLKVYGAKNFLQRVQAMEFLIGVYLRKVFADLGSIHVTPGCFSVYRKKFFDDTGPYQEGNLTEDIEVAYRIQTHDYVIENSIDAQVYTLGVPKFRQLMNQRLRWYKGFLDNTIVYKKVFNPKYGNLGVFVLPSAFLSIVFAIVMSIYALTRFADNIWMDAANLYYTGFDISQYFRWTFDPFFINLNGVFILGVGSLVIGLATIYIAKKWSKESQPIALSYVFFALSYLFLFAFWWVVAGYYKMLNKKVRWGNIYM
ncbi:MAG: glycosyltransferase [Candidatus Nanoarchaeia archaeon]